MRLQKHLGGALFSSNGRMVTIKSLALRMVTIGLVSSNLKQKSNGSHGRKYRIVYPPVIKHCKLGNPRTKWRFSSLGKSSVTKRWIFQPAMLDYRRVFLGGSWNRGTPNHPRIDNFSIEIHGFWGYFHWHLHVIMCILGLAPVRFPLGLWP